MEQYFKSMAQQDFAPVVICGLDHKILYMNPAAISRYHRDLTGCSLLSCHNEKSAQIIQKVIDWFLADIAHNRVHTFYNEKENKDVYMIALRDARNELIGYYEKHEYRDRDTAPLYVMV